MRRGKAEKVKVILCGENESELRAYDAKCFFSLLIDVFVLWLHRKNEEKKCTWKSENDQYNDLSLFSSRNHK